MLLFLQVLDNSPAQRAGLETYFDFVVSINGVRLVCPHVPSYPPYLVPLTPSSHAVTLTYTLLSHTCTLLTSLVEPDSLPLFV